MAVHEALADAVGILGGVGVTVMSAVVTAPPADRTFDGTATNSSEEDLKWKTGRIRLVCPKTMVSSGNAKTSPEVVYDGPNGGLPTKRRPESGNAAHDGNANDQEDLIALSDML